MSRSTSTSRRPTTSAASCAIHEIPELIRVAAPVYVKFGLRNAPGRLPAGTHLEATTVALSRERVRRARLGLELLARSGRDHRPPSSAPPGSRFPRPVRLKGAPMARPVTLFTGQWADLPIEELAANCGGWGFDGLELACWGDHFEVDKATRRPGYASGPPRAARAARPRRLGDRRAPRRPGGLRPDRRASPRDPAARGVRRRRTRGCAARVPPSG